MADQLSVCLDKRFLTPALVSIFQMTHDDPASRRRRGVSGAQTEFMMDAIRGAIASEQEVNTHNDFQSIVGPDCDALRLRTEVCWKVWNKEMGAARDILRREAARSQNELRHPVEPTQSTKMGTSKKNDKRKLKKRKRQQEKVTVKQESVASEVEVGERHRRKKMRPRRLKVKEKPMQKSEQIQGGGEDVKAMKAKTPWTGTAAQQEILKRTYKPASLEHMLAQAAGYQLQYPTILSEPCDDDEEEEQVAKKARNAKRPRRRAYFQDIELNENPSDAADFPDAIPLPKYQIGLCAAHKVRRRCIRLETDEKPRLKRKPEHRNRYMGLNTQKIKLPEPTDEGAKGSQRGIPAKTFRAVMRLVLGLPLCQAVVPPVIKSEPPRCRPPVWAESRQELCEALPYYRSFQSSLYMNKRVAYAYLLDGYPSPRDAWAHNGRVIISHGGGQCIRTTTLDGKPTVSLQADQSAEDSRVDALLQCEKTQTPIVLIAGTGYAKLPWKMPHAYAVMGWYWISSTWVEAEHPGVGVPMTNPSGYYTRYKIRFDWVESQGVPWWERQSPDLPEGRSAKMELDFINNTPTILTAGITRASSPLTPLPGTRSATPSYDNEKSMKEVQTALWAEEEEQEEEDEVVGDSRQRSSSPGRVLPGSGLLSGTRLVWAEVEKRRVKHSGVQCPTCATPSPHLYEEGWTCLQPDCKQFWMLSGDCLWPIPPSFTLTYRDDFLLPVTPPQLVRVPYDLVPEAPVDLGAAIDIGDRSLWRGWVCDQCGRANCRFRWEVWECKSCGRLLRPIEGDTIPASDLTRSSGPAVWEKDPGVKVSLRYLPNTTVTIYKLPGAGTVYHITHTDKAWADAIFEGYQQEAQRPLFERKPLKGTAIRGQLLAQHFAVNSGATYKYNVASMSMTFDESPRCVMSALDAIKERVSTVLGERVDFNEILSVLYREGQKMSWHDDGEKGLGDVVASLSLGSSATMSWRLKPRNPIALSLTLSHGDIIVMQGREMQMLYDHRVVPCGFRIAATARVIGKGH